MRQLWWIGLVLLSFGWGCEESSSTPDQVAEVDVQELEEETEVIEEDTAVDEVEELSPVLPECTRTDFAASVEDYQVYHSGAVTVFSAKSSSQEPFDELYLEIWGDLEAGETAFTIENYEDCSTCLTLYASCAETSCAKIFLAQAGSLQLEPLEEGWQSTLRDLVLVEVTLDGDESTWVEEPEGWCIAELVLSSQ